MMIRKWVLAFVSATLLFSTTQSFAQEGTAPMIKQGNRELGIAGSAKISGDSEFDLNVKYGWFVQDAWEVGVTVGSGFANDNFRIQGGLFTEYNFNRTGPWVPFIGASTEIGSANFNSDDSTIDIDDATAFIFGIDFGVKYFIRPGIALTASAGFEYGLGDSVFGTAENAKDAAGDFDIGLRVYF